VVWRNARGLLAISLVIGALGCGVHGDDASPAQSQKRLDLAKDFLGKHELEAAENEANKAIAYNKGNDEAYNVRGLISMVRAIDTQRTMEIDSCLSGLDRDATVKDLYVFLEKADQDFERATKVTPDYGEAWANRGVAHTLLEDYSIAVEYLNKALENPARLNNAALTRAHLGWALFHEKKYVEAAKELRQAKQFAPKMCVATYRLARVYFARDEWDKAAEQFQAASDDPTCGSQEASYYLMMTRIQQGLTAEAKEAHDACLKRSPQSCVATRCKADGAALHP
jgi:tetratricopeptide (TPR) repeat protein